MKFPCLVVGTYKAQLTEFTIKNPLPWIEPRGDQWVRLRYSHSMMGFYLQRRTKSVEFRVLLGNDFEYSFSAHVLKASPNSADLQIAGPITFVRKKGNLTIPKCDTAYSSHGLSMHYCDRPKGHRGIHSHKPYKEGADGIPVWGKIE